MKVDLMPQIAGTIITETKEEHIKFLVNKQSKLFIVTSQDDEHTAMATIIEEFKSILSINFDKLELVELTNTSHDEANIPLYVFSYPSNEIEDCNVLVKESDQYAWLSHRELKATFNQLNIEGVPTFK